MARKSTKTDIRCAGCGKVIEADAESVGIFYGKNRTGFQQPWGYMHLKCFNRSITHPEATLRELRQLASCA